MSSIVKVRFANMWDLMGATCQAIDKNLGCGLWYITRPTLVISISPTHLSLIAVHGLDAFDYEDDSDGGGESGDHYSSCW
ncbi:hypothetical protein PAAG_11751 [Paracoccidioides lutzii Pb01]|uniref:Uncharacterized protein n=1 Tax=Paracoccidioides lutzii (strain ATCC MYA-826 / Pb01) TaxID=502779 RepID=A0A0A2V5U5_PARBA|nr:hypothetical protein PAAG_11751 [Paracoccidioides lutzii Pb01]KGQ01515.1 hypothetical protein PAAG_11751 [Paracoccidioides lutzii Pb01]